MKRILHTTLILGALPWLNLNAADAPKKQPNILLLIADDMSHHSTGYAGDPVVKTPSLDKLAAEGVVFSHAAVTTSICMVSRASMLTGQYLTRMGAARVTPQTWPDTWPARLRAAGYYGGHIGKIHVLGQEGALYDFWAGRHGAYHWINDEGGSTVHSIQKDTDEALKLLQTRPKDKPFFLQVAYTVPHAEDRAPEKYLPMPQEKGLYTGDAVPVPKTATQDHWLRLPPFFRDQKNESRIRWQKRFDTAEKYQSYTKDYYRLISGMDRSIGVILEALRTEGVADNTVVVFIGDNGYFLGEHGLADKWYAYEESLRVPMVVRDPRLPADRRGCKCDDWVLNVDIAPTFCALAGLNPPAAMQGRDISALLNGRTPADWRKDFLYQFKWGKESIPASEGVCGKDLKYIRWVKAGTEEMFDLRNDPLEEQNLSSDPAHAADLSRMRARIEVLKKEVGGTPLEDLHDLPFGVPKNAKGENKSGENG